ncbi:hypothetical protein [Notoacmeibacter ruber]|uniref:DUF3558 domain-containing protein n=1 Tax=Notoacmeibacter ruber TaxID=2670375 RepID=A0A3L7JE17_9HYPH|nr:hypothetical protein [Notoacmeibacter ruber]RLQ89017.1 hypothetical protein D8780_13015 [Notoacmeibacter ruber]
MQSVLVRAIGRRPGKGTLVAAIFLVAAACPSEAAESRYQTIDTATDCELLSEQLEGGSSSFLCDGPAETPFIEDHGDLRTSVAYGIDETQGERNWESFTPFNFPRPTIEWRFRDGSSEPFATIRRWSVETGSEDGARDWSILVVSRIGETPQTACTVGYIDARRIENANVMARIIADAIAEDFHCRDYPPIYRPDDRQLRAIVSR